MEDVSEVLAHTPPWAIALFAYLVWMGIKRLDGSLRKAKKIWIVPVLFIAWGLSGLLNHDAAVGTLLPFWAAGALVGAGLGWSIRMPIQADRSQGLVFQPGSVIPLIRNVFLFGSHFALRAASVGMHDGTLLFWDCGVSGASAGYFAGWAVRFLKSYQEAGPIESGRLRHISAA